MNIFHFQTDSHIQQKRTHSKMLHIKTSTQSLGSSTKLFLDESTADIHFTLKSKGFPIQRVPAHQSVLIASSKVFQEMFREHAKTHAKVKESSNQMSIEIADVNPIIFRVFLQCIYHGDAELSPENVDGVLSLGMKYNAIGCLKVCEEFLIENLTNENVCWSYWLAIRFDRAALKKMCEVTIGINIQTILKSYGFLKCDRNVLNRIVKLNSLSCSEFELFNGCESWVKRAAGKRFLTSELLRSYLGQSINEIRFHLMTLEEFISIYSSYETLFTANKRRHIIHTITAKEFDKDPEVQKIRSRSWLNMSVFECERDIEKTHEPYFIDELESAIFSTNQPVLLRGISCAAIHKYNGRFKPVLYDLVGRIEIVEYNTRGTFRTAFKDDYIDLECYKIDEEYGAWLNKPIIIKANNKYEIRLNPLLNGHFCTNVKLKSSCVSAEGITVKFHGDHGGSKRNRGLIFGLILSHF